MNRDEPQQYSRGELGTVVEARDPPYAARACDAYGVGGNRPKKKRSQAERQRKAWRGRRAQRRVLEGELTEAPAGATVRPPVQHSTAGPYQLPLSLLQQCLQRCLLGQP